MAIRPHGHPAVGDPVRVLHLAGPEDGVVVAIGDHGRALTVQGAEGEIGVFRLRAGSGLYVDDRQTRLAFDPAG